jgi:N-acetylglucosaminyldiphosphoundecaprenol N-acetyl-beta-D-mannosaminyltransferase
MRKILFIALHLGYGGVEQAIINEANLLSKNFDVTIISVYKLMDNPAFELCESVKVIYLLKERPNKQEIMFALKRFSFICLFIEIIKALVALYNKRTSIIKYLRNNQYDIIISTRYYFDVIVSKYYNGNALLLAREHRHHNNDRRYIKRICNAVRNFNYFLPVSKELTEFYSSRLKGNKVIVRHIPNFLKEI